MITKGIVSMIENKYEQFYSLVTENEKLLNNELFSYTYPSLYEFMIYQSSTYKEQLERLIKRILI